LSDWPSYLDGPAHSSYNSNATAVTTTDVADLQPVWRWTVPKSPNSGSTDLLASPTVSDGVVYIGAKDGYFFAVDEATRTTLWSAFLGINTPKHCAGCSTQGITSTATVATDPVTGRPTVYVDAPDGYLYALDARTGAVVWKGLVDTPSAKVNNYYAWGSPLVVNGDVYIGISSDYDDPLVPGGLVAFDQGTGARVATWNSLPAGQLGGSIWSSAAALPDGSIIATTGNGYNRSKQPLYDESIVRLDPTSLALLDHWQVPPTQQVADADFGGSPTLFTATIGGVATAMVGACNKNGVYYAFQQDDLSAGPVWHHRMSVPYSVGAEECDAAATWDGTDLIEGGGAPTTIRGTTFTGSVQSLDPATGKPRWQTGLSGTIVGSPSEDGAGVLAAPVLQSTDGRQGVYLLSVATGSILGFIPTPGANLFGQAVFSGSDLVLGAGAGLGLTDYEITTPGAPLAGANPSLVSAGATETVRLTGSGFAGQPTVLVSGGDVTVRDVTVASPTSITVTLALLKGATTGPRDVSVVEPGTPDTVDDCAGCVTVVAPPTLSAIAPASGAAGSSTPVTLTGTGFAVGASVKGPRGVTFSACTVVGSTTITATMTVSATVAPGSALPVTVTNDAAAGHGTVLAMLLTVT
jgi:polyvinyl alcohol dehydrogenase (cytochrome)